MGLQRAVQGPGLPKALGKQAVDEVEFYVILVFFLTGPAVQIICEPYHILDDAVLLVHIREPGGLFSRRGPGLRIGLPSCGKGHPVVHRQPPVAFDNP